MLNYPLLFLIVGIVAGVLGFGFNTGTASSFAKLLAIICLGLLVASYIERKR
jgi:uncharacterized membrane protein YtjA (UPF0391 family)